jgi:hypothetical protein
LYLQKPEVEREGESLNKNEFNKKKKKEEEEKVK